MKSDYERLKTGLCEAISLLCKNGLRFQSEMSVEGLLGITLDHNEVFLVNIKEIIRNASDPYHYTPKPRDHRREPPRIDVDVNADGWQEDTFPKNVTSVLPRPAHSHLNFLRRSSSRERSHRRKHNPMKVVNIPYSDEELDLTYSTSVLATEATDLSNKETNCYVSSLGAEQRPRISSEHVEHNVSQHIDEKQHDKQTISEDDTQKASCSISEQSPSTTLYFPQKRVTQDLAISLEFPAKTETVAEMKDQIEASEDTVDDDNDVKTNSIAPNDQDNAEEESTPCRTDDEDDHDFEGGSRLANQYQEETKENSGSSTRFANSLIKAQLEGRISEVTLRNSLNEESRSPLNQSGSKGSTVIQPSGDSSLDMLDNDDEGALVIVKEESSEEVEVIEEDSGDSSQPVREGLRYLGPSASHSHSNLGVVLGNMSMPVFPGVFPPEIASAPQGPIPLHMPLKIPQTPFVSGGLWTPPVDDSSCSSSNPGNGTPHSGKTTPEAHSSSRSQSHIRTPHLQKRRGFQCINCGTSVTTMWRRDEEGRPVCNPCGLYYKLHKKQRPLSLTVRTPQARRRKSPGSKIRMFVPGSGGDEAPRPNTSTDALS